jgi:hypothetical protein
MKMQADSTFPSALEGVTYDPNTTANLGPQGWVDQLDEGKRLAIETAVIGDDALDWMPQPNFINKNLFASKLDSATSDADTIKIMREAIKSHERDLELFKKYMESTALKGQAALDLAAHKIELREVKALAVDATRQYSKQVLELTGDGLPIRTPEAEKAPKTHATKIFEDFFLLGVLVDNIAVAHFKSN